LCLLANVKQTNEGRGKKKECCSKSGKVGNWGAKSRNGKKVVGGQLGIGRLGGPLGQKSFGVVTDRSKKFPV